ncbi:MAG: DUF692 family protein [Planctomycetota bacterium]|nr:DUF692 family protein [Planctomycetota bacterium]
MNDNSEQSLSLGLSLMPSEDFIAAAYELFEAGEVDVLEWSFDMAFARALPEWASSLLSHYSEQSALLGHGVTLSLFSPDWQARQDQWLETLGEELKARRYLQVSEHFGFMTSSSFHDGSPMPLPHSPDALQFAVERLRKLQSFCPCPVGLENLSLVFNREQAFEHGRFLGEVLAAVDGYLVLDIHNLFCLTENFQIEPFKLLESYPLDRVREIHISGGSWFQRPGGRKLRRDTHDGPVPTDLFEWLSELLKLCPNIGFVILERIAGTMQDPRDQSGFRDDYRRLKDVVARFSEERGKARED